VIYCTSECFSGSRGQEKRGKRGGGGGEKAAENGKKGGRWQLVLSITGPRMPNCIRKKRGTEDSRKKDQKGKKESR